MATEETDETFLHSLIIHIPFPNYRLANTALGSLSVDEELSELVKRDFKLVSNEISAGLDKHNVLRVHYKATTPRMLRVAVNGFFESLGLIVQLMEEVDVDVLHDSGNEGLEGVQGVEQGMTGMAMGAGV